MSKILFCLFMLLCFSPSQCSAAEWKMVLETNENKFYVDIDSVDLRNKTLTVWEKAECVDPFKQNGIKTRILNLEVDLENAVFRVKKCVIYMENGEMRSSDAASKWEKINFLSPAAYAIGESLLSEFKKIEWTQGYKKVYFCNPYPVLGFIYTWERLENESGEIFYYFCKHNKYSTKIDTFLSVAEKAPITKDNLYTGRPVFCTYYYSDIKEYSDDWFSRKRLIEYVESME